VTGRIARRIERGPSELRSTTPPLTAPIIMPVAAQAANTRPSGVIKTMSRKSKSLLLGAIVIVAVLARRRLRTPSNHAAAGSEIEESTENRPSGA